MVENVRRENALRLLLAINDLAKGRVGETVAPNEAAQYAGLESGTEEYDQALQALQDLIDWGVLVAGERYKNVVGGPSQGNVAWRFTQRGSDMLGEEE